MTPTSPKEASHGLTWGIKRRFVDYVGGLPDGQFAVSAGASTGGDHVFWFPLESMDDFDPVTRLGVVRFGGRADLNGHFGMMSFAVDSPWLEFSATGTQLTVRDLERGPGYRVPLLELDVRAESEATAVLAREGVPARLSVEGTTAFNGQYLPAEEMDPVSWQLPEAPSTHRTNADPNVRLSLIVAERVEEAKDVISLSLTDPTGAPLPAWSPGSHVDVRLRDGLVRQYSLSSSTSDRERWRVTILKEEGGVASTAIHDALHVGTSVEVSLPRNNFVLEPSHRYVFVAGGIGITPIVPMIEAAKQSGAEWTLVYSGRSRDRMAFVEELAHHGDNARVVATATEPRLEFTTYFAQPQPGTLIYACGPEGLLQAIQDAARKWPTGSVHLERFVPMEFDDSGDVEFEVEFAESGVTATVPVGRSILEVAEELHIPVISSCSEGTCGTCETAVLSGTPDHRDSILSDSERAANRTMFLCVSRSVGGRMLRLDI
jgi:ferredoxin-NADP reductase